MSLKALIFDSYYDSYKGAVSMVRIFDGEVTVGDEILFMQTKKSFVCCNGCINVKEVQSTRGIYSSSCASYLFKGGRKMELIFALLKALIIS